jgi:hypothetical protein
MRQTIALSCTFYWNAEISPLGSSFDPLFSAKGGLYLNLARPQEETEFKIPA